MTAAEFSPGTVDAPLAGLGPAADADVTPFVTHDADGRPTLHLMVEGVHCGGCVKKIESRLGAEPAVVSARVNFTTRRLTVSWSGPETLGNRFAQAVADIGFPVHPFDPARLGAADQGEERALLLALGITGFAMANVMLLSISVWAGHASGMGEGTRGLFHWIAALIALPSVYFGGRPFFRSAWSALRRWRTNMDVPISIGVVLATAVSVVGTFTGGRDTYFESALMLLFFLLIGRFLDRRARGRARSAAERLVALGAGTVTVLDDTGHAVERRPEEVAKGARVLVAAGSRIGIDGVVETGTSSLDQSLITGESLPVAASAGTQVFAGTVNLDSPITVAVTAVGEGTLLGEIVRLMEAAESRKARHVALADRAAAWYAPVVHTLALLSFLGWVLIGGLGVGDALMIAVAVLIITCPCALGLAVPAVQVIASGRLIRRGILLKSPTALERLVDIDRVAFDKTGTLTLGRPSLIEEEAEPEALTLAASLAAASRHPLARAMVQAAPATPAAEAVREVPGQGLEWQGPDGLVRLGSRTFAGVDISAPAMGPELWLARPGRPPIGFSFTDPLRADAGHVVKDLVGRGLPVSLLSGDRAETVADVADRLGITERTAEMSPSDKVARLEAMAADGHRVMMVGDGLNDAPALAAAHVSVSPATAADVSQTAADAVFQGDRLAAVLELVTTARRADELVRQNLRAAVIYNAITVPIAVAGFVTPLIAAVAMSASSVFVVVNALRLER